MWFVKRGDAVTFLHSITLNSTPLHSATFPILLSSTNMIKLKVFRRVINVTSLILKKALCYLGSFFSNPFLPISLKKQRFLSVPVISFWAQWCSLPCPKPVVSAGGSRSVLQLDGRLCILECILSHSPWGQLGTCCSSCQLLLSSQRLFTLSRIWDFFLLQPRCVPDKHRVCQPEVNQWKFDLWQWV